jgi:hypothetical protein
MNSVKNQNVSKIPILPEWSCNYPPAVTNLAMPRPPDTHFDIYVERNIIREEKWILSFQELEMTNAVTSVTFVV